MGTKNILEEIKENTKSARYWEKYLEREKVFDMLINDATVLGLKENFSNVPEIIRKLFTSKVESPRTHRRQRFLSYLYWGSLLFHNLSGS